MWSKESAQNSTLVVVHLVGLAGHVRHAQQADLELAELAFLGLSGLDLVVLLVLVTLLPTVPAGQGHALIQADLRACEIAGDHQAEARDLLATTPVPTN